MSRYARQLKWKQRRNPTPQLKSESKKRSVEDLWREREIDRKKRIFQKTQVKVQEAFKKNKLMKKPKQNLIGFDSQIKVGPFLKLLDVEADGHCFYHSLYEAMSASNVNINPPTAKLSVEDKALVEAEMAEKKPLFDEKFNEFAKTSYISITRLNKKRKGAELRLKIQILFQKHFTEIIELYQTDSFLPVTTDDLLKAFTWNFEEKLLFLESSGYVDHQIVAHAIIYLLFKDLKIFVHNQNEYENYWEKYSLGVKKQNGKESYFRQVKVVTNEKVRIENSVFLRLRTVDSNGHFQPYVVTDPKQETVILSKTL